MNDDTFLKQDTFSDSVTEPSSKKPKKSWFQFVSILVIVGAVLIFVLTRPPSSFPEDYIYQLESGMTLRAVSTDLQEVSIIRSSRMFELYAVVTGGGKVIAGDYLFEKPLSMMAVAKRVMNGDFGDSRKRVVLPEGSTINQMAEILERSLVGFDKAQFLSLAKGKEGYLFPDTYFFFPSITTEAVFETLSDAFETQIAKIQDDISVSGYSLDDIIIMASLIEKEAGETTEERHMISGILWKRITIGMALQVDAPFLYTLGKGSSELTLGDLRRDSPYNTYTNLGLPPGPIGNPGIASIRAALYPTSSPFLFYLHGSDGVVRYARTFEEHITNKNRYLR